MSLAERIKKVRESLGLSQSAIAKAAGSSLASWQGYEAGKSVPGGKVFEALVRLGFNVNWILTGEGQMRLSELGEPSIRSTEVEELGLLMEKYGTKALKEDLKSRLLQIKRVVEQ